MIWSPIFFLLVSAYLLSSAIIPFWFMKRTSTFDIFFSKWMKPEKDLRISKKIYWLLYSFPTSPKWPIDSRSRVEEDLNFLSWASHSKGSCKIHRLEFLPDEQTEALIYVLIETVKFAMFVFPARCHWWKNVTVPSASAISNSFLAFCWVIVILIHHELRWRKNVNFFKSIQWVCFR